MLLRVLQPGERRLSATLSSHLGSESAITPGSGEGTTILRRRDLMLHEREVLNCRPAVEKRIDLY